jgi:hypothetical protein
MNSRYLYFALFAGLVAITSSCNKDGDRKGCTDPIAANYDPRALTDDESCIYNDAVQSIWVDGMRGGWNGDLQEGAFKLEVCAGELSELETPRDSGEVEHTLYLGTGGGTRHLSYFSIINERNARDFNNGSLQMDVRVTDTEDGAPEFVKLFISGKLWQDEDCDLYRRSEYVEISTHSFNDSTFTKVNIPILRFDEIMMAHVNVVCGVEFEGERSTGIEVNNIQWIANTLEEEYNL